MTENLAAFWNVFEPTLPIELFGQVERTILAAACDQLPGQHALILECRLAADAMQVDISQKISPDSLWIQRLASGFPALASALMHWSGLPVESQRVVNRLGLEYDLREHIADALQKPSLFFGFQGIEHPVYRSEWFRAVREMFANLIDAATMTEAERVLAHIETNSSKGWTLGLCGVMTARTPSPIRINLTAPSCEDLCAFLDEVMHLELPANLRPAYETASAIFGKPVVCLDVFERISSRIGLELFPSNCNDAELEGGFLDMLVSDGLCSAEKRASLRHYPMQITPDSSQITWPDSLILESIMGKENEFSIISAHISHYKLTCQPGKRPEAKVYISYKHEMFSCQI